MFNKEETKYLLTNLISRKNLLQDIIEKSTNDLYWHIKSEMKEDEFHCKTLISEYKRELAIIDSILNKIKI